MAPPKSNVPRPGRTLAVLAALIVVLVIAVVGKDALSPSRWHKSFAVKLGLDLSSGTTVTLKAVTPNGGAPPAANMQKALEIIRERVNGTGVTEAQVTQQGNDIITVAVPGAGQQKVVSLVGKTAQLRFRQVLLQASNTPAPSAAPTPTPSAATSSAHPTRSPSSASRVKASPTGLAHALGGFVGGAAAGGSALDRGAARLAAASSRSLAPSAPGARATATPSPSPSGATSSAAAQGESTSGVDPQGACPVQQAGLQ